MRFWKYHGLGNDYLVVEAERELSSAEIRRICHRNFGVGSDGILLQTNPSSGGDFGLRILNPDGSEAEKSGNGLRIFSRYLFDIGAVEHRPFTIDTLGGQAEATVDVKAEAITVSMGQARLVERDVALTVDNRTLAGQQVDIGNPHFVLFQDAVSPAETLLLGPLLEAHAHFPARTNVQFARIINRQCLQLEIWERGAGYTLASGSSSCAAAAAAFWLGHCDACVTVQMPGGNLAIAIDERDGVTLTGPVVKVMEGVISAEMLHSA